MLSRGGTGQRQERILDLGGTTRGLKCLPKGTGSASRDPARWGRLEIPMTFRFLKCFRLICGLRFALKVGKLHSRYLHKFLQRLRNYTMQQLTKNEHVFKKSVMIL